MIKLLEIMKKLRSPEGCPWDREQTFDSLREYVIEEAYEVVDAIDKKDFQVLCEELGDLLLQIAFQSIIAEEKELFDYNDVETSICQKMIERHTHVFGEEKANNSKEVLKLWNKNKLKKKGSVLDGIPDVLPALMKASKINKRLTNIEKDVKITNDIHIPEEIDEMRAGEILYSLCSKLSLQDIDAESALNNFIKKRIIEVDHER